MPAVANIYACAYSHVGVPRLFPLHLHWKWAGNEARFD